MLYVILEEDPGWKKLEQICEFGILTFSEDKFKKNYGI